jgi:multidrug efflux pump subunit AcrA (membrane-fusion protein)
VRRGDLVVSASGAGTLVPASEIELSFPGNGLLTELNVQIGDIVRAGDVLAKQDDTGARKAVAAAELQILQAEIALNSAQDTSAAEDAVGLAESNLAAAQLKLDEILNWEPDPQEIEHMGHHCFRPRQPGAG